MIRIDVDFVAQNRDEILSQLILRQQNPMCKPDRVILAIDILKMHTKLASVFEKILDRAAHIAGDNPDLSYPELVAEDFDIVRMIGLPPISSITFGT